MKKAPLGAVSRPFRAGFALSAGQFESPRSGGGGRGAVADVMPSFDMCYRVVGRFHAFPGVDPDRDPVPTQKVEISRDVKVAPDSMGTAEKFGVAMRSFQFL